MRFLRFGQADFIPKSEYDLNIFGPREDPHSPIDLSRATMRGEATVMPPKLRTAEGAKLCVKNHYEFIAVRGGDSVLRFDPDCCASTMRVSSDGRMCWSTSSECRGLVFANVGFSTGQHYWEVKVEAGEPGNIFVGVSEKAKSADNKFQRWTGMGFVNFRATTQAGAERIYGCHYHHGDIVGVMLDCDAGRLSFFLDGIKFGEHFLQDLGCAFESISPFGYAGDGLGSGGLGMGAPNGSEGRRGQIGARNVIKPLYPVVGLRAAGDLVTFSYKQVSTIGTQVHPLDTVNTMRRCVEVLECLKGGGSLPTWFSGLAHSDFMAWKNCASVDELTRGKIILRLSKCPVDVIEACVNLGMTSVLLPGDLIKIKRVGGRTLELSEEAVVLGAHNGNLYYKLISQKEEGGSLVEGGGRAWMFGEADAIEDGHEILSRVNERTLDIVLPLSKKFCGGRMEVVYPGGAVVRSDLEIDLECSKTIGNLSAGTELSFLEKRVCSNSIVRYKVEVDDETEQDGQGQKRTGWCSGRIRGGNDDVIVHEIGESEGEESITIAVRVAKMLGEGETTYDVGSEKLGDGADGEDAAADVCALVDAKDFEGKGVEQYKVSANQQRLNRCQRGNSNNCEQSATRPLTLLRFL